MHYIKIKGEVIAFKDPAIYDLARYAMVAPGNIFTRQGGGFTIFDARTAKTTDLIRAGNDDYRISFYPCKDSVSLYNACKLIKGVFDNGA